MANLLKKIKLSNGVIYAIRDNDALRLNEDNVLITGNGVVDELILHKGMSIIEIDDVPVEQTISNVLVQDVETGKIMKRSTNKLLEDIGGTSYAIDSSANKLILKVGK